MSGKVLIITYYWPPSGGGGVQRWLKFAKYLPELGWDTTVFTPENPEFELKDETLLNDIHPEVEVVKFPIWEPFGVYKRLFGKYSKAKIQQGVVIEKSNTSFFDRLIIWIRGNCFVPDPRRYWIKPSVAFLTDYINEHQIDVIISTGPPHSMHMIGQGVKQRTNVKWIADFRDPWSDWDILDKLNTSNYVRKKHVKLEKAVLKEADVVLTVTRKMGELFREKCGSAKIKVITNGIDMTDFMEVESRLDKFRITHLGLLNELRNPTLLWEILDELCKSNDEFESNLEVLLAGTVSRSITDQLHSYVQLQKHITLKSYIPHNEIFTYYQNSSILLLLMNQTKNADWLIPAKLFEYLASKREVLALGSKNGDVNDILTDAGGKEVVNYMDKEQIRSRILAAYDLFKQNKSLVAYRGVDKFHRKELSEKLVTVLGELIEEKG